MNVPVFVQQHWIALSAVAYVLVNATTALPTPRNGNNFYKWFFTFCHATFGGLPRLIVAIFPTSGLAKLFIGGNTNVATMQQVVQKAVNPTAIDNSVTVGNVDSLSKATTPTRG